MIEIRSPLYASSENLAILNAHALAGLSALPDGSVHCIVTSPPYLGLRDYGTTSQVWGGSADCRHDWQEEHRFRGSPQRTGSEGMGFKDSAMTKRQRWSAAEMCRRCGAWRGEIGAEPLHDCLSWAQRQAPCSGCYVCHIRMVLKELYRVLRSDGTLWLNLGDSYNGSGGSGGDYGPGGQREGQLKSRGRDVAGLKPKDLIGVPWRVALAAQADGWYLRSDIIWHKPNRLPESVRDRPSLSHEYLFLLTKSRHYFYDMEAIREPHAPASVRRVQGQRLPGHKWESGRDHQTIMDDLSKALRPAGRNRRSVWTIPNQGFRGARFLGDFMGADGRPYTRSQDCPLHVPPPRSNGARTGGSSPYADTSKRICNCQRVTTDHFATFPKALVDPCILAGTSEKGACARCGAPWHRITKKSRVLKEWRVLCGADLTGGYRGEAQKNYDSQSAQNPAEVKRRILAGMRERTTVGWDPGCSCEVEETAPCVVFDPFMGAGTTGVVALLHQRCFVGIEIKPEYCELSRRRLIRVGEENKDPNSTTPAGTTPRCDPGKHEQPPAYSGPLAHARPAVSPQFWRLTRDGDPRALSLFLRHYSARHYADGRARRLFVGPGQKMVLLSPRADALFVWRKFIDRSGESGVNAAVFRNEGRRQSSRLIREAVDLAWQRWPGERLYTYVDPGKVKSSNPGYCFQKAGWRRCGATKGGLAVLEVRP